MKPAKSAAANRRPAGQSDGPGRFVSDRSASLAGNAFMHRIGKRVFILVLCMSVALASMLTWIILRFFFDTPWQLAPLTLAAGVGTTTVLAVAVGFLATWRLLGEKPLPVLRRE